MPPKLLENVRSDMEDEMKLLEFTPNQHRCLLENSINNWNSLEPR